MNDDPARARFFALQAARVSGIAVALLGLAITRNDWVEPGGSPLVGGILLVAELLEFALVPLLLARRWRSPK